jgi:hypothetical protein
MEKIGIILVLWEDFHFVADITGSKRPSVASRLGLNFGHGTQSSMTVSMDGGMIPILSQSSIFTKCNLPHTMAYSNHAITIKMAYSFNSMLASSESLVKGKPMNYVRP